MDQTLLQRPRHSENSETTDTDRQPTASPPPAEIAEALALETEQAEFRELLPADPQPPLRMKFDPAVEFDGETYSQIVVDFDALTGNDFMRCERKFQSMHKPEKNETIVMPEMKPLYHCLLLECASKAPLGLIRKLPRKYYVPLRQEALKACGSSSEEEKA
jgi:hypothetical protein